MVKEMFQNGFKFIKGHLPEILTGLGVAGTVTTPFLAVKANNDARDEIFSNGLIDESRFEQFKIAWKYYIPPVLCGAASVSCILGAHMRHQRIQTAIMALYMASEEALSDYKEEARKLLSGAKAEKLEEDAQSRVIDRNPVSETKEVIITTGETLCYDAFSDRYFEADLESLKKTMNELNQEIMTGLDGTVSLNEYYQAIGLPEVHYGYDLGWDVTAIIDLKFSSKIADNGKPCIVVGFYNKPFIIGREYPIS